MVLERSPLVKDKLLERATQQIDLAKRNLDFNSSGKPDRNVRLLASSSRSLNQGSRTRGGKEGAAIRSDSGSETTGTQPQNDAEGSSGHSWLDPTRFLCLIFFVTSYMFLSIPLVSNLFVQSFFLRIFRNFKKGSVTVVLLFIAMTFLVKQTTTSSGKRISGISVVYSAQTWKHWPIFFKFQSFSILADLSWRQQKLNSVYWQSSFNKTFFSPLVL